MLQFYPDRPSGSTRLAYDEAVYLAQRGHEVWVVTQDESGGKPAHAQQDGLHVLRYPSPRLSPFDPRRMFVHQRLTHHLLGRYVGGSVDFVHGHSLLQYAGALQAYGKTARTCYSVHSPVKLEMQAATRDRPLAQRVNLRLAGLALHAIERRCLERSLRVTADSRYTASLVSQLHGPAIADKVKVIPGWVDLDRFTVRADREELKSSLGWPSDKPVLFTLRRLVPRMGLDRLIEAAREVKAAGLKFSLVIGGAGPLRDRLQAMVSGFGLTDEVRFLGFVPDAELPLLYAAADAFVLPTAELECFGLIALEALACGRPVLATPVGAIPEVLGRVEPRWLAADADAHSLAKLLTDYLVGALPSHQPAELRAFVEEHYSRAKVIETLVRHALGPVPVDSVCQSTA